MRRCLFLAFITLTVCTYPTISTPSSGQSADNVSASPLPIQSLQPLGKINQTISQFPAQINIPFELSSGTDQGEQFSFFLGVEKQGIVDEGYTISYKIEKKDQSQATWYVSKHYPDGKEEEFFFPYSRVRTALKFGVPHKVTMQVYPLADRPDLSLYHITIDNLVIGSFIDYFPKGQWIVRVRSNQATLGNVSLEVQKLSLPTSPVYDSILAFGDSITFGHQEQRDTDPYPAVLASFLGEKYSVINAGNPGEKTDDTYATRNQEGLLRFKALIDVFRPEYVLLFEGTNNVTDPGVLDDLRSMLSYAAGKGVVPIITTLPPLYTSKTTNAINASIRSLSIPKGGTLLDLEKAFLDRTAYANDLLEGSHISSPRALIALDGVHPVREAHYKMARLFERVLRSLFSRRYNATWLSQGAVKSTDQDADLIIVQPGNSTEVQVEFQNTGSRPWLSEGEQQVGLYVYRDPYWSTPPRYNESASPLFGTDFYASNGWGSSISGTVLKTRAASLSSAVVHPGEKARFTFLLSAGSAAKPHPSIDDPNTYYDDRYDRSDFSLAAGPDWINNTTNGDSLGIAHVWFKIQVRKS